MARDANNILATDRKELGLSSCNTVVWCYDKRALGMMGAAPTLPSTGGAKYGTRRCPAGGGGGEENKRMI